MFVGNNNSYDVQQITNKGDEIKIAFIDDVKSQEGIPANFKPLSKSNENKIFFRTENNREEKREWLFL